MFKWLLSLTSANIQIIINRIRFDYFSRIFITSKTMNEVFNFQVERCLFLMFCLSVLINNVHNAAIYHSKIWVPPAMKPMDNKISTIHDPRLESNHSPILIPPSSSHSKQSEDIIEVRSSNEFYPESFGAGSILAKMNPNFDNIPPRFIGPNYALGSGSGVENSIFAADVVTNLTPQNADTMNDMLSNTLKKYDIKRFILKKILGNSHDLEEDGDGFFSNKHLRRHGTAGVAAKVIGELIGIKIRESIEGIGKSFSEYAKDFTARNFVNLGQLFGRVLKF